MKCVHGVTIYSRCEKCELSSLDRLDRELASMNTITKLPADITSERVIPAEHPAAVRPTLTAVDHEAAEFTAEQWASIPPRSIMKDRPQVTAHGLLKDGARILEARAREYDKPGGERSIAAVVTALNAIVGRPALNEAEGWLFMQLLKDVRLFSVPGYHVDSGVDVVNYSALMSEAKARTP